MMSGHQGSDFPTTAPETPSSRVSTYNNNNNSTQLKFIEKKPYNYNINWQLRATSTHLFIQSYYTT